MAISPIFPGSGGGGGGGSLPSSDPYTTPRTPKPHKATHASGGSDAITPAAIGAPDFDDLQDAINVGIGSIQPGVSQEEMQDAVNAALSGLNFPEIIGQPSAGNILRYVDVTDVPAAISGTDLPRLGEDSVEVKGHIVATFVNQGGPGGLGGPGGPGLPGLQAVFDRPSLDQVYGGSEMGGTYCTVRIEPNSGPATLDLTEFSKFNTTAAISVTFDADAQQYMGFPATAIVQPAVVVEKLQTVALDLPALGAASYQDVLEVQARTDRGHSFSQWHGNIDMFMGASVGINQIGIYTYVVTITSLVNGPGTQQSNINNDTVSILGTIALRGDNEGQPFILAQGATSFTAPPTAPNATVTFYDGPQGYGSILCRVALPVNPYYQTTLHWFGTVQPIN